MTTFAGASAPIRSVAGQPAPALAVEDLTATFGSGKERPVQAVRGVSFSVLPRQTLALLGESGSGKSVTARSLLRLHGPSTRLTGRVLLGGVDLLELSPERMRPIRNRDLALVPQDPVRALDPLRRIGTQMREVLLQHGIETSRRAARRRAEELLRKVGIADPHRIASSYPNQLSGGMCQRVVIAIAVSCHPSVLVADEPTTALDVTVQAQILELFAELQSELGTALLMVTHDVGVAAQMADQVAVMYAGRIVEQGPADLVLENPSHPYTAGLLASIPAAGIARGHLSVIPGQPLAPGDVRRGCPFSARCSQVTAGCLETEPALDTIRPGHSAACIHPILSVPERV